MQEYAIKIGPRELTIRTDESPEHIEAVQALLTQTLDEAGAGSGRPHHTALLFATLTLADQLLKERKAHTSLKERIRSRSRELLRSLASRTLEPFSANVETEADDAKLVA